MGVNYTHGNPQWPSVTIMCLEDVKDDKVMFYGAAVSHVGPTPAQWEHFCNWVDTFFFSRNYVIGNSTVVVIQKIDLIVLHISPLIK